MICQAVSKKKQISIKQLFKVLSTGAKRAISLSYITNRLLLRDDAVRYLYHENKI